MTPAIVTRLPKSQVKLDFTVSVEDAKPYLDQAVIDISTNRPIKGFRPGKATYEDVKRAYGEMAIWESALERIVRALYVASILENDLDTIGSPSIDVAKLVPGNDIQFSATADLMPSVERMPEYDKPLVDFVQRPIGDKEIEEALQELRTMRRVEVAVDRAAGKDDLVVVDLEITKSLVVIEGGVSRNFKVYLNEAQYIPGFADKLVGIVKGEKRSFELPFPEDHFNKMLAGNEVTFNVTAVDVFELQLPLLDDELAKAVGVESLDKLKELLKVNLQRENDQKSDEAAEIKLLELLVKEARFSEIPEILVNEEVRRMVMELTNSIDQQGMRLEDYLASIKKSMDELRLDFIPQGLQRIQTAVLMKEIAKREKVEVSDEMLDAEIDRILGTIKPGDTETRERVLSAEYRDYVGTSLRNRQTLALLKLKAIKGYPHKA